MRYLRQSLVQYTWLRGFGAAQCIVTFIRSAAGEYRISTLGSLKRLHAVLDPRAMLKMHRYREREEGEV